MNFDLKTLLNRKLNFRYGWLAGALLLPCVGLIRMAPRTTEPISPNTRRVENSSAARERIVNEVEPLCRALVPDRDTLRFQVYPLKMYSPEGASSSFWVVECFNAANQDVVHAIWNDDAKRMSSMSLFAPADAGHALAPGKEQAEASARRWLAHLNMASQVEALSSPGKTALLASRWRVDLALPGGRAIVWLSAESGALEHIRVRKGENVFARIARRSSVVALRSPFPPASASPHRAVPILPPPSTPGAKKLSLFL